MRKRRRNDSKTNARAVFWFVKLRPLVISSGTRDAIFEPRKMRITVEAISCKWYKSTRLQGWILKFQKGGAGSRILEREGGRNLTFQCRFPSFSYKSLANIPPKGGTLARPAPPLNPRLAFRSLRFAPVAQGSFATSALTRVLRTQLQIPSAFGARLFFIYLFIKKLNSEKKSASPLVTSLLLPGCCSSSYQRT